MKKETSYNFRCQIYQVFFIIHCMLCDTDIKFDIKLQYYLLVMVYDQAHLFDLYRIRKTLLDTFNCEFIFVIMLYNFRESGF